jgi:glycosyltransferase involved in cell wall biosynthesis
LRIGLFIDAAFRSDGDRVWTGSELLGFGTFAAAVGRRFERFVLIARGTDDAEQTPFELPPGLEHYPLPFYRSLRDLGTVLVAIPKTVVALWRALGQLDAVWVSAANPMALLLVGLARLRGIEVAILVRQDTMAYYRTRLPSPRWRPVLMPLAAVDAAFRRLGHRLPTTAVGHRIAADYGAPRPNVLEFEINLIEAADIPAEPPAADADLGAEVSLLTVGRVEPEKSPFLLADALALLERSDPGRFRSTWAGEGRLRGPLGEHATQVGVGKVLSLPGFVPFGPGLIGLYRGADIYVHVALTEGVPGVICEAMANGLPVVATDVGGIRDATGGGAAALLVPPQDPAALAAAVRRVADDAALRRRLVEAGLERARWNSLDVQSERVATFLAEGL